MLALLLVALGSLPALASDEAARSGVAWLNQLRSVSGLPPVEYDATMTPGAVEHARYMVKTGTIGHSQDPASPWFSEAGHTAAQESNVALIWDGDVRAHVSGLHAIPFHQIGQMRPRLQRSTVGFWTEGGMTGGVVNVIGGLDPDVFSTTPVAYPGPGSTSPLRSAFREWPDPLTSCPGYTVPTGASIVVLLPTNETASAVRLTRGTERLDTCLFDASSYHNPDQAQQDQVRYGLDRDNAIVVIP